MGRALIIAEKPSVGRDIAEVLGCKGRGDGFLAGEKYIVSWAVGHLVTLWEPEEYNAAYKKWRFETLPIIPEVMRIKPIAATEKQFGILKNLMQDTNIDYIICATDAGREGELIFRYTYEAADCRKPFKRLWISSMTDDAIKEGFASLKDGAEYDNLYYSAKCRSEADWLVGMNASRAFTLKYDALLSVGRVQTPTLAIIVNRQKEIDSFVPQDYFEVNSIYEGFKGVWFDGETKETKIFDRLKAEEIAEKIKGKEGFVLNVENEKKKQVPPLLYDLTELQRDCNKKFGYSAQKTLDTIQSLYEKRKMVTYPRTDSRYLSSDMVGKIKTTLSKLTIEPYKEYASYVINLPKLPISKRIIDDSKITDHHAIIPTDVSPNLRSLSREEFNVYDLIAKRFICVFYPNYEYTITRVTTEAEEESFLTKGKTILKLGWMELYKSKEKKAEEDENEDKKEETEADEQELPKFKKKDKVYVTGSEVVQKKTKAPSAYNEAALLSAMENAGRFVENEELKEQLKDGGLGTPATRAAIIERLIKVGYIERKGKTLYPTEKGKKLIEIVPFELKSPETTGKWEKGLTSISKGKLDSSRFMQSIQRYVRYIIKEASVNNKSVIFEEAKHPNPSSNKKVLPSLGTCPICKKGHIFAHSKGFYCSEWRKGCKFTIWSNALEAFGISIDSSMAAQLISNGKIEHQSFTNPKTKEAASGTIELKGSSLIVRYE